jgi:hypothetical protein
MKSDAQDAKKRVWGFVSHGVTNSMESRRMEASRLNMVE